MSPIKPKNRALYPPNWKEIRLRILDREGHRCKQCKKPNGLVVTVGPNGQWYDITYDTWRNETGAPMRMSDADMFFEKERNIKVILTVAHMDQDPTNNDETNLAALCQRCHLNHDRADNMRKAAETRRRNHPNHDLFDNKD